MSLHRPIVFFIELLLFPLCFLSQGVSAEDPPAALLLCNWKYHQLTPLLTPEADVTAMKAVLEAHNPPFEVTVVANGSKAEMETNPLRPRDFGGKGAEGMKKRFPSS